MNYKYIIGLLLWVSCLASCQAAPETPMISGSGSDIPREISSHNAVSNNEPESQSATESMSQQSSSDAPSEQHSSQPAADTE